MDIMAVGWRPGNIIEWGVIAFRSVSYADRSLLETWAQQGQSLIQIDFSTHLGLCHGDVGDGPLDRDHSLWVEAADVADGTDCNLRVCVLNSQIVTN